MRERSLLHRLAARLARDRPIDWDAEEQVAQAEDDRATLQYIRVVAAVASFHRAVQAGGMDQDLGASVSLARSVAGSLGSAASSHAPREPEFSAGSRWGQLEILQRIGRGAFGDVYRARDTRLDRIVALKILVQESAAPSDEAVREARLLARVHHPHVVTVHGADRIDNRIGIWMEFLEGETLDQILRTRGPLDAREAALVGIDLCRALSAVHAAGIIHQDVKLGNVMRAAGGRIVLMDFGLGRETRQRLGPRTVSGTPLFMAPEVLRGSRADARSDVYSLGVVLFSLVTGTQPVVASSLSSLKAKHERGEAQRARDLRPDLAESFAHVLDRALAPDPKQRFATPGEVEHALLQALGTAVQSQANTARPARWRRMGAVGLAGLLVLAATLAVLGVQGRGARVSQAPEPAPLPELPNLTLVGEHDGDMFGLAIAAVGDVDQDGFDDVLVGAPHCNDGAENGGKIYWYRGTPAGLDANPAWTATGSHADAVLGWSMASFTTLSFDGFDDLVVGMPGMSDADPPLYGSVRIYAGSASGPAREPVQELVAARPGTLFGCAVATGDVNHDGFDDLLVGEPHYPDPSGPSGRAYLFLAQSGRYAETPACILSGRPGSGFGITVSLGDVNHDGYWDAVVGASSASFGAELSECGAAYVYLGSATGLDSIPVVLPGRQAGEGFGSGAFFGGDLDADGFTDLIVGAERGSRGEDSEGIAEIYFGSREGISPHGPVLLESNMMGANFGGHGGGAGDLDGDGCDDLFLGAIRYQKNLPRAGAAFLFRGSKRREITQFWFRVHDKTASWYGTAGGVAGDVDADGFPDFVVSAAAWDNDKGLNVGQVELFLNTRKR